MYARGFYELRTYSSGLSTSGMDCQRMTRDGCSSSLCLPLTTCTGNLWLLLLLAVYRLISNTLSLTLHKHTGAVEVTLRHCRSSALQNGCCQSGHQAGKHSAENQRDPSHPQDLRLWLLHKREPQPAENCTWHSRLHRYVQQNPEM